MAVNMKRLLLIGLLLSSGCAHRQITSDERLLVAAGITESVAIGSYALRPKEPIVPIVASSVSLAFIITYFIARDAEQWYVENRN